MASTDEQQAYQELKSRLSDRRWRLNNLYWIKDKAGNKIKFRMNAAQERFYDDLHCFNVILKARQLGFTTFTLLLWLDICLFNSNQSAGVIAHTLKDADDLFKNKVKFAYDNLPDWLKAERPAKTDRAGMLELSNGSLIAVGTSLRSGTFQMLLVSEYGKIAARFPEKAKEIKSGALNTVQAGSLIVVESTAEGKQGEFFDLVSLARRLEDEGRTLTPLDPKFHFFPWWKDPGYVLDETGDVSLTLPEQEYFAKLAAQGISLTPQQKTWYVKKAVVQRDMMKREFPSTPDEAFEVSLEGAYFTKQMEAVRKAGQINPISWEPSLPVHTFWDIADNRDYISVWFFQHVGHDYRFLRYVQASGEDYGWFKNRMNEYGYVYGTHYWPHDGGNTVQTPQGLMNKKQIANSFGIAPIKIVKRTPDKQASIDRARSILPRCRFCAVNAAQGIALLDAYRKQWNDKDGIWRDKPRHDEASHCADAFMTFADGYDGRAAEFINPNDRPAFADHEYNPFSL